MKTSRRCQCRRGCPHLARGSEALLPAERLVELEPLLATLIDAADAFDADSLIFDEACGIHGEVVTSNSECSCRGDRTSAVEFVEALQLDIRSTGRHEIAGRPGRKDSARVRALQLVAAG